MVWPHGQVPGSGEPYARRRPPPIRRPLLAHQGCGRCARTTRAQGLRRSSRARPGRVGIYACGPTVYGRIHVGNARPFVVFSLLKRFLEHEGYETTLVVNVTDVNDKIYDAARPPGVPSAQLAVEMTAPTWRTPTRWASGGPTHEPLASETIGPDRRPHRRAHRARARLRGRRRRLLPRAQRPRYGSLSHRDVDDMDQGEGVEGADRKEDPLDFALWKGEKQGEDTAWDAPWGRGPAGLAHRVLGDGRGAARRRASTSTAAATTSSSPTTRTRRPRRGWRAAAPSSRDLDAQRDAPARRGEDGQVGRQHRLLHDAVDRWGRDALLVLFFLGPLPPADLDFDEPLDQARGRVRRLRDGARRSPGESPAELAPLRDAFFAALADDFNTPAALAALFEWVSEATRRERGRAGDSHLREMLGVLGLELLARRRPRGRPPRSTTCSPAPGGPGERRTSPRPTACATSCGRAAGRCATPAAELVALEPAAAGAPRGAAN